jgi:pantoate--beta-alanine ligase
MRRGTAALGCVAGENLLCKNRTMKILTTIAEIRPAVRAAKEAGKQLGFVPTMGALHEGHVSLVRLAKERSDVVVVSIFVNPRQFGPNEDFSRYPRTFTRDQEMLEAASVDLLFAPSVEEMYPKGAVTSVNVEGLSERLDGVSRPGHFRGVTTVVSKLFNIMTPDIAVFGQKDAAQVAIIKQMVRDMNMPVEIIVGPIVREPDGLAMSSRNAYLNPKERKQSLALSHALQAVQTRAAQGEELSARLTEAAQRVLNEEPEVRVDYIAIVNRETLEPVEDVRSGALVAVAAYVGGTRLIDNVVIAPSE